MAADGTGQTHASRVRACFFVRAGRLHLYGMAFGLPVGGGLGWEMALALPGTSAAATPKPCRMSQPVLSRRQRRGLTRTSQTISVFRSRTEEWHLLSQASPARACGISSNHSRERFKFRRDSVNGKGRLAPPMLVDCGNPCSDPLQYITGTIASLVPVRYS